MTVCGLGHALAEGQLLCPNCGMPRAATPSGAALEEVNGTFVPLDPERTGRRYAPAQPQDYISPTGDFVPPSVIPTPTAPVPAPVFTGPGAFATRTAPPSAYAAPPPHEYAEAAAPAAFGGDHLWAPAPSVPTQAQPAGWGPPPVSPPGAGWSPAPWVPAGPAPRQRRSWIMRIGLPVIGAVVALGAVGAVVTHKSGGPSASGTPRADGTTTVDSRGIGITAPPAWTVQPITLAALAAQSKAVLASDPTLAKSLSSAAQQLGNGALRFFAYGPRADDGSVPYANILVGPNEGISLSRITELNEPQIRAGGALNITITPVTLATAGDSEKLSFILPITLPTGGRRLVYITEYYIESGGNLGVLALGTDDVGATASAAATLSGSFRLT